MGITGAQRALMVSAAGLLRSAAGRAGYSAAGWLVPLYAISNIARSGATRSNYYGSGSFIAIDGFPWGLVPRLDVLEPGILNDSLVITDVLDQTPNQCQFTAWQFQPREGQRVTITLGTANGPRLFSGRILNTEQYYDGRPENMFCSVNAIDDTWGLDTRKVSERYQFATYDAIVRDLVAKYAAPTYTVSVEPGLGSLDEITFTNQDLPSALNQLAKRGGYSWLCDDYAVVRFFATDTWSTPPTVINAVHKSLADFKMTRDFSQVITRVYVEGGGVNAAATLAAGETILPLDGDPGWYNPAGGTVVSGPQRIRYTGVYPGGGGGLVGPGASPSGRPIVNLASGAGMSDGTRSYAVTYTTAAGESIPSPPASITSGKVPAPATAPIVTEPPGPGMGPDAGAHTYVVTFATDAGETTAGPPLAVNTDVTAAPAGYPVPQPATQVNGNVPQGPHDYALSFVTDTGETPAGPIGPTINLGMAGPPTTAPTGAIPTPPPPVNPPANTPGPAAGVHLVAVTFGKLISTGPDTYGETLAGPTFSYTVPTIPPPATAPAFNHYYSAGMGGLTVGTSYRYAVTYSAAADGYADQSLETTLGPISAAIVGAADPAYPGYAYGNAISLPPIPAGVKWIKVYRSDNGAPFRFDGSRSTADPLWFDAKANYLVSLEPIAPTVNTAAVLRSMDYTGLPIGPPGTTRRGIYRTVAGGSALKLVERIANNSATTYTDTIEDAALGVAPPAASTLPLSVIPLEIPTAAAGQGVTGRRLYRRSGGLGLKLVATIGNNSATLYNDSAANADLGAPPTATNTARLSRFKLTSIPTGPPLVRARNIYRTRANDSQLWFLTTLLNNTATTFTDTLTDSELGAAIPVTNTAVANQVQITAIPIGAASVTSRKVYRTISGGSTLQLLVVLADNVTTAYLDAIPDAGLGAVAPAADTSGLQQPTGSVNAGSTSFQVASIGVFPPAGWAVIGNGQQVIRYTAIVGNSITGIPASGPGSIQAAIAYNSTVTASPELTGIPATGAGAIRYSIPKGDPVNLWIQRDNLTAQAETAALLGTDGIVEGYLQDRRLSQTEAEARGDAHLALRSAVDVGVTYSCRDVNTRAGRTATVNLPSQHTVGSFKIQSVTIGQFGIPGLLPTFLAVASSNRFTFEDLIRAARKDGA